jgi:hypothetical protein
MHRDCGKKAGPPVWVAGLDILVLVIAWRILGFRMNPRIALTKLGS